MTHAASDTAPPRGPSPRSSTAATTKKTLDWEEGVGWEGDGKQGKESQGCLGFRNGVLDGVLSVVVDAVVGDGRGG